MKRGATEKDMEMVEYLRRNTIHCASVGARAGAESALERLGKLRKRPKWLVEVLEGIASRAARVASEMASHRDELSPYRK